MKSSLPYFNCMFLMILIFWQPSAGEADRPIQVRLFLKVYGDNAIYFQTPKNIFIKLAIALDTLLDSTE